VKQLVIRADANPDVGMGHVMRCFAIAEAAVMSGEWEVEYIYSQCPDSILQRMKSARVSLMPYPGAAYGGSDGSFVAGRRADWAVVDGYEFNREFFSEMRKSDTQVLALDDVVRGENFDADIVLNQNPLASAKMYSGKVAKDRLCCGAEFVLLRNEFRQLREIAQKRFRRVETAKISRILLTTGGSDELNVATRVIETLGPMLRSDSTLNVVIGSASRYRKENLQAVSRFHQVTCQTDVESMARVISDSDFVITSAGSTVWECLVLGVPFATMVLGENQRPNAEFLSGKGIAANVGAPGEDNFSGQCRRILVGVYDEPRAAFDIASRGQQLVDGYGVFRVLNRMAL